jgi:hypothetical protein
MSTSNPIQYLVAVRAALAVVAPTFIRGTFPVDSSGKVSLPNDCIILDPITAPVTPDYDSEYATIILQVTAWSRSLTTASTMAEAAEAILKLEGWRLTNYRLAPTDDEFRGVQADYETLK